MKPRRVIVTLEIESDQPIGVIAKIYKTDPSFMSDRWIVKWAHLVVKQVQVNVIRPPKQAKN